MIFTTNTKPVPENERLVFNPKLRRFILGDKYRAAKNALALEFGLQGPKKPISGPVEVLITARTGRADLTAWNKILCDCLNGIAYEDDKQIESITVERTRDKNCPLVTIVVEGYSEDAESYT